MPTPILSYYGRLVASYPAFLQCSSLVVDIQTGKAPATARYGCYSANSLRVDFIEAIEKTLGVDQHEYFWEIFYPIRMLPPHVDEGGQSYAIALNEHCTINIGGVETSMHAFGIYSFDGGVPHQTKGPMLMIKKKPSKKQAVEDPH